MLCDAEVEVDTAMDAAVERYAQVLQVMASAKMTVLNQGVYQVLLTPLAQQLWLLPGCYCVFTYSPVSKSWWP